MLKEAILKTNLHDWASLRPRLLFAFDQAVPARDINGKWERRSEFSAWLLRKGWVKVTVEGESCICRPGQWLVLHARKIEQEFSADAQLLSLRIAQSWPDGAGLFLDGVKILDARRYPKLERTALPLLRYMMAPWGKDMEDPRDVYLWKARISYFELIDHERELLAWLKELALALSAESAVMHVPKATDARVTRVLQILDLASVGEAFPKERILKEGGLSLDRLNQLCLKAYDYTLHRYWENRRLDWACRMLESRRTQIKEIALELGFGDLPGFSGWFKRHRGRSPRQWRAEHYEFYK